MQKSKETLLERYGIPINHLDFQYVKQCSDAREIEKIVHILRSGEEGYYPDLTACAEEKLRELKPGSRLFRLEQQIKASDSLGSQEMAPIYNWNADIQSKDQQLLKLKDNETQIDSEFPPVRRPGLIEPSCNGITKQTQTPKKLKRIPASTDYRKWDRFDADEETLRIELAEERAKEAVERKNRLNTKRYKSPTKFETIVEEVEEAAAESPKFKHFSDIEKEKLSEQLRLRGNEYFRAKEYDKALIDYTKAIQAFPEKAAAAYNNRAQTYLKQQSYLNAINDCENCLALDPNNLKGRLRLAEAHYCYGRKKESYKYYVNVLELDPTNAVALKTIEELRKIFEDLPPPMATRLNIIDGHKSSAVAAPSQQGPDTRSSCHTSTKTVTKPKTKTAATSTGPSVEYDLAELIKPYRLVKNKMQEAAENVGKFSAQLKKPLQPPLPLAPKDNSPTIKTQCNRDVNNTDSSDNLPTLLIPGNASVKPSKPNKPLIEEI